MNGRPKVVKEGFGYLEAARWRDGYLYFSDIKNRKVHRMRPDGDLETIVTIPQRPSGLGWTADGDMLVIGMEDNTLNRVGKGGRIEASIDLNGSVLHANDMAVDPTGRAYVTQFGYDLFNHAPPAATHVTSIAPDGAIAHFGSGLVFPNGIAISADGRRLIVAESFGYRLNAFDIAPDGSLSNQRIFADFGDDENNVLDGLCIDAEGAVWVAMPFAGEFRRVLDGGTVTDVVKPTGKGTYCVDCVLGGDDGRTLFLLVADTNVERMANDWDSEASIQTLIAEVPAA
ncbi:MAG: SMP-30/gluconolactonase/LRE family protein [Novosphingobium sp.]